MKAWIKKICTEGMRFPYAHDTTTGKPSITLMFPYITFMLAVVSAVVLHFNVGLLMATITCIGFWVIATILYMMRRISKAKFDIDDGSFEIDSEKENGEHNEKT